MTVQDNFSQLSPEYARYRPLYPEAVFIYLSSLASEHKLAWDCATGNGQAAHGLAPYFETVLATDASHEQISNAAPHEKIIFKQSESSKVDLPSSTVDLVTVAQAVHWFDFDPFYSEVKRVLKPEGNLAVWCYQIPSVSPQIDAFQEIYFSEILGTYWAPGIQHVIDGYASIPFPFEEIQTPVFSLDLEWDLSEFLGFLYTWSAAQEFRSDRGYHPIIEVEKPLRTAWRDPDLKRTIHWNIHMRVGRNID
jgi:ubiquinone/menaquinone biosynthesis C-methylase UbiE